jgi:hypothetical protein
MSLEVIPEAAAIFNASVRITLDDGSCVLFWEDPWIQGLMAGAISPNLLQLVRPSMKCSRIMQQGLKSSVWYGTYLERCS